MNNKCYKCPPLALLFHGALTPSHPPFASLPPPWSLLSPYQLLLHTSGHTTSWGWPPWGPRWNWSAVWSQVSKKDDRCMFTDVILTTNRIWGGTHSKAIVHSKAIDSLNFHDFHLLSHHCWLPTQALVQGWLLRSRQGKVTAPIHTIMGKDIEREGLNSCFWILSLSFLAHASVQWPLRCPVKEWLFTPS